MSTPGPRTLADLLASGVLPYDLFLDYADQLARQLAALHARDLIHGHINAHAITVSPDNKVALSEPDAVIPATPELAREDLYQVGLVYAQMLSESRETSSDMPLHPIISDNMPLDTATYLMPVEARLLLEELLAEDPSQRIATARELASTVGELRKLHQMPLEPSVGPGRDNAKFYFVIAMLALAFLVVWVIAGIIARR